MAADGDDRVDTVSSVGSIFSTCGTNSGPTITTSALASLMICAISVGASRQLTDDVDRAELRERERDLEELEAVLVEERDAVAGARRRRPSSALREPVRARVELAEGDRAALELERRGVRPLTRRACG